MILSYPPILRGFLALIAAGVSFPLVGVLVLRMNLITLRFALLHAALLGGALSIALGIHPAAATVLVSSILVMIIGRVARASGAGLGPITTMTMAVTVAAAAALTYRFNVPARDTLSILWGNVYAVRPIDLWFTVGYSAALLAGVALLRRQLTAMMYSREVAFVSGMPERELYYGVLFAVALTVGVAMRLLGALMLDVLLLLPALVGGAIAKSIRALFIISSAAGLVAAVGGFFLSVEIDIPASSGVAAVSVLLLVLAQFYRKRSMR